MKTGNVNFWGFTRWWWLLLVVGIIFVIAGFCYWVFPFVGFTVTAIMFGWLLVASGVVQLCVSASTNRPKGWGWWIAGGVLNVFLGFVLIRSILLTELVLPYFFAITFFFWGVNSIVGAVASRRRRYWWLNLVNGLILLIISYFFMESGLLQDMVMISMLTAVAFIYWGFSMMIIANDMRPEK